MRFFRISILFLCLSAAGGWFLFAQRTVLAEQALRHRLQAFGATNVELAIADISINSARVSSLHASFPDDSPLQSLSLQNLVLRFKIKELFKGSLTKLSIESLNVSFAMPVKPGRSSSPPPLQKLRSYIPAEVLIKELHLSTPQLRDDLLLRVSLNNPPQKALTLQIDFSLETLQLEPLEITGIQGELLLQTDDFQDISVQNSSYIEVDRIQNAASRMEKSRFQFSAQLNKRVDHSGWKIPAAKIAIITQGVYSQNVFLQPGPLSIDIIGQSAPLQADLSLTSETLSLHWKGKNLALRDIQLQLKSEGSNHTLNIQLSHAGIPGRLDGEISHNSDEGSGNAIFATSLPFDLQSEEKGLSQVIRELNIPLDVSAGLVTGEGIANWKGNTLQKAQGSFRLQNAAGSYGKTSFTGLLVQQDLELFPKVSSRSPGYLYASEINNGLTLKNLSIRNQLLPSKDSLLPILLLDSIQTELFAGTIRSRDIYVDLQDQELDCIVQLERMDLREIIMVNKMQGLQISGILDGSIHIQWKDHQLNIPEGELHSRAPGGTINYLPPGGGAGLSSLPAYAMKALEEFNYDTLIAIPIYKNDGTLTIDIKTEGHSPPLKSSRPVHLNLNTEQNILSLLQSLRYSKTLTDELDQRLRAKPLTN